jgi:hypothetical protein
MKQKFPALLIAFVLAASSLLMIAPVQAEVQKPSVPDFYLKYVDHSYDVPTTYGTDPYTGKAIITQEGYHVQNNSVEVIIKNQAFTSYHNENGSIVWLYYRIVSKGHFENWNIEKWNSGAINMKIYDYYPPGCVSSDESENTVIAYGLAGNGEDTSHKYNHHLDNVSIGGQVDFRVQGIIGYSTRINESFAGPPIGLEPGESYHYYIFTGKCSELSDTQTVTIGETSAPTPTRTPTSATPNPTVTAQLSQTTTNEPTQPDTQTVALFDFDWEIVAIVGLVVAVTVLAVGLLVVWRRLASFRNPNKGNL